MDEVKVANHISAKPYNFEGNYEPLKGGLTMMSVTALAFQICDTLPGRGWAYHHAQSQEARTFLPKVSSTHPYFEL